MECRICLDSSGILLFNTCSCKGTQGAIHATCLKQWVDHKQSPICDICKQIMSLPYRHPVVPNAAYFLTTTFDWCLRVSILFAHRMEWTLFFRSLHWILFPLYIWIYSPIVQHHASLHYLKFWLRPVYFHGGRFIYPLPNFVILALTIQSPPLLFFFNPYREFWYFHKVFLERNLLE